MPLFLCKSFIQSIRALFYLMLKGETLRFVNLCTFPKAGWQSCQTASLWKTPIPTLRVGNLNPPPERASATHLVAGSWIRNAVPLVNG